MPTIWISGRAALISANTTSELRPIRCIQFVMPEITEDNLKARVREIPLLDRLNQCRDRIGKMCSERRGPRMCIPVNWDDDDFFISVTLEDAAEALRHNVGKNGGMRLRKESNNQSVKRCGLLAS